MDSFTSPAPHNRISSSPSDRHERAPGVREVEQDLHTHPPSYRPIHRVVTHAIDAGFRASDSKGRHIPFQGGVVISGIDHWEPLVQLGGLEPPTSCSTDRRSNQLSYNCILASHALEAP